MNPKEEQTNSEVTNLDNESSIEKQKDVNCINENIEKNKLDHYNKITKHMSNYKHVCRDNFLKLSTDIIREI